MKTSQKSPTARIAVKRNVLKQYRVDNQDVVYLKKGSEFEIELFNPLQETILAEIHLNNKEIGGGGLVLRPGERVFLERYLTEDRKFKFEVYQVENSEEVKQAVTFNGLVTIKFFREKRDLRIRTYTNIINTPWYVSSTPFYGGLTVGNSLDTISCNAANLNGVVSSFNSSVKDSSIKATKSLDTGIIAKGNTSQQDLIESFEEFQEYPFSTINVKILPDSQQVFSTDEIKYRKYCSECGSKLKPNDKFCSNCGTKI